MIYGLIIDDLALEQLRGLSKEVRRNIEYRYRLRVGTYRVLFRLDDGVIHVYAVKQRKDAYE